MGKGVGKPERQGSFKTIGAEKWGRSKTEQAKWPTATKWDKGARQCQTIGAEEWERSKTEQAKLLKAIGAKE